MSSKVKPRHDHNYRTIVGEVEQKYFSISAAEALCHEFGINDAQELARRLNGAAQVYFGTKSVFEDGVKNTEVRAAMSEIKKCSDKLGKTLASLDERSKGLLNHCYAKAANRASTKAVFIDEKKPGYFVEEGEHGHKIVFEVWDDESVVINMVSLPDMYEAIELWPRYAEYVSRNLAEARSGPRRRHGLYMWASNLRSYWTETLGRPFTLDVIDGMGNSDAYRFCAAVTKIIEPDMPPNKLHQPMRKVIAKRNRQ